MNDIDKERFGGFLARLRREKNLTQRELAERLFVSDKAVSKWERGLSLPDVGLLLPMADCLGVTVTELLRGERTAAAQLPVEEVGQGPGEVHPPADGGGAAGPENPAQEVGAGLSPVRPGGRGGVRRGCWPWALRWRRWGPPSCCWRGCVSSSGLAVLPGEGALPAYYDQNQHQLLRRRACSASTWPGCASTTATGPTSSGPCGSGCWGSWSLFPVLWGVGPTLCGPAMPLPWRCPLTLVSLFGMLISAIVAGKRHE